jgi:hypothetical protein
MWCEGGDVIGSSAAGRSCGSLRWTELLKPENGGPGEVPGRAEAIALAKELTAERKSWGKGKRGRR